MFKNLLFSCALLGITFLTFAQNTTLKGKITTQDGKPAEYVSIKVAGTAKGAITDSKGTYLINNLSEGTYKVEVSIVGLIAQSKKVTIQPNQDNLLDFVLQENNQQLQEVIVIAERNNQFAQKETEYVSRLPLSNLQTPQSYSVVTANLLKEQLITDITSSLKSITGGAPVQSNDGNASIYIRGFRSDAYIKDGLASYTRLGVDNANIERIEVIKGPSATLFGGTSANISAYGGVINRVSKKPTENQLFEFSYLTGAFDLNRITVDFNHALDKDQKVLFRVNTALHSEKSFQDNGFQRNILIAPSLLYKHSDRVSFLFDAQYYSTNRTLFFARGINFATVTAKNMNEVKIAYDRSYTSNDMAGQQSSLVFHGEMNYNVSEKWTSKTSFQSERADVRANYLRLVLNDENTLQRRFIQFEPRIVGSLQVQQDFVGVHSFGKVESKTLIGGSYLKITDDAQRATLQGPFVLYDNVDLTKPTIAPVSARKFEEIIANTNGFTNTQTKSEVYGIYATQVLSLNKMITALVGLRWDNFSNANTISASVIGTDGFTQSTVVPKFGLTVTPLNEKLAFYGNYMSGFTNKGAALNTNNVLENFKPEKANQWEIGTKINLLGGKIISTLSYYDIKVQDILRINPTNNTQTIQDGEQKSSGLEVELIANPMAGLNLVVGYTNNKAEYVKVSDATLVGKRPIYTPETMTNYWISYQFLKGKIKGFGLGFGSNYVSDVYYNDANTFTIPAYTTTDAVLFYNQGNFKISCKINNLGDVKYWNLYAQPQNTRNVVFGLTIKI